MSNNNPSLDPANNGTLVGAINFTFKKLLQDVNGMLPAQVVTYDRTTNRAQVQLMINIMGTDGQQYPRPQLASIPVFCFGGGGYRLSFPLLAGNPGWVMANDRDISLYLQSLNSSSPNTARIKSFSDGVFFPDVMTLSNLDSGDVDNVVLQNDAGTITISLSSDKVTITTPKLDIDLGSATNILAVNGLINASGTINPSVPYVP